jgi:hypothetical protein
VNVFMVNAPHSREHLIMPVKDERALRLGFGRITSYTEAMFPPPAFLNYFRMADQGAQSFNFAERESAKAWCAGARMLAVEFL